MALYALIFTNKSCLFRIVSGLALLAVVAFSLAACSVIAKKNGDDGYYGNYQIDDHLMGIDRFIMDNGEKAVLISDYKSGVVRRLFPVNEEETEFEMGPGFNSQNPAELNVQLLKDRQGFTTGLELRRPDGTTSIATRVPLRKEQVFFEQADATLSGTLIIPESKGPLRRSFCCTAPAHSHVTVLVLILISSRRWDLLF